MQKMLLKSLLILMLLINTAFAAEPLSSWNDTATKQAIITFVEQVTQEGSPYFVPVAERIATFDNDGTLCIEQPQYLQDQFIYARIKALAPQHPEWKYKQPFKAVLENDEKTLDGMSMLTYSELIGAAHAGCTADEFAPIVREWLATARHPQTQRAYTDMVYQPMLELLSYLRENGFKTYIVTGSMVEFMRPWTEQVYGVSPEQVIGSSLKWQYELRGGEPAVVETTSFNFQNDATGKPIGIQQMIGRRPIAAFGNSDGDMQMLLWTTSGTGMRFGLLVHHTDADREWAYDRKSAVGKLDKALDAAKEKGWTVVDMKADWKVVYPFEKQ